MYEISVSHSFDAAHFLRDYRGKCARMHGHTWTVEAVLGGDELGPSQQLMDFGELKAMLRAVLEDLDHSCLNEVPPFDHLSPTAENLARYLYERLEGEIRGAGVRARLLRVRVSESPEARATYTAGT